jgi:hypothetical protein
MDGFNTYMGSASHRAKNPPHESQPRFELRVSMPSDPRFLSLVHNAVGQLASILGGSEEESRATMLAIDEVG